jgi:hypothetical protein
VRRRRPRQRVRSWLLVPGSGGTVTGTRSAAEGVEREQFGA